MPTSSAFLIKEDKNFEDEKQRLVANIKEVFNQRNKDNWPNHPMFGEFTSDQIGKMLYKHMDHHLRQFGV
jgi:hypothetical protein